MVDDDFAVASLHRAYLEELPGFTVVAEAHSARQALRAVEELKPRPRAARHPPPGHVGLEVLQRLRARPGGQEIDVIAITAAREVETVRAAMSGGVAHYLVKPFTLHVFRERLEEYAVRSAASCNAGRGGWGAVRDQDDVDRLLSAPHAPGPRRRTSRRACPGTLSACRRALQESDTDLSAAEAAEERAVCRASAAAGTSSSSARWGWPRCGPRYGGAGRPENGYVWAGARPEQG